MYAVIRTGGKQYRVTAGDILEVEKLNGAVGDTVTLDDVLMVSNDEDVTVGQPVVDDASVTAKITGQYRGKKIMVFRYRPKKRIRVRRGHRQYLTRLEIESITAHGETYTGPAAQETTPAVAEEEPVEAPAVDETIAAAGVDETVAVEEPVAATQTSEPVDKPVDETAVETAPDVDETNAAVQKDVDSESNDKESDSVEADSEDSVVDKSDSEDTDSKREDKE